MRKMLKLALVMTLFAVLLVSPAVAKKAPVERTVVDGIALAEVKVRSQITPYYPASARVAKRHAEVVLTLEVNGQGRVSNVDVISTSVEGLGFDVSAADAVKQWRFHPALKDGEPIDSVTVVRLTFAPPTLRSPDGFVFTERAARFFAVQAFDTSSLSRFSESTSLSGTELPSLYSPRPLGRFDRKPLSNAACNDDRRFSKDQSTCSMVTSELSEITPWLVKTCNIL